MICVWCVYNVGFHVNGSKVTATLMALNAMKNFHNGTKSMLNGFMDLPDSRVYPIPVGVAVGVVEEQPSHL